MPSKTVHHSFVPAFRAALRAGVAPRGLPWFRFRDPHDPNHRIHRVIQRARYEILATTPAERLAATLAAAGWPLYSLLLALRNLRRSGREVLGMGGPPLWRQFLQQLWAANLYNITPAEYYTLRLFEAANRARIGAAIANQDMGPILREVIRGVAWEPVDDKVAFFEHCRREGLPTAMVTATFEGGEIAHWFEGERGVLPQRDLAFKLTRSSQGRGFERWDHDAGTRSWSFEGRSLDAGAFLRMVLERSRRRDCHLQHAQVNHPEAACFARNGSSTLRLISYRFPTEEPRVLMAFQRMPRGDVQVDNLMNGGIFAMADPASGVLGTASGFALTDGPFPTHPDTGAPIEGHRLPCWSESVELCLRAHATFPAFPFIAWDVIVTPGGPTFLEANTLWGIMGDMYLGETPFVGCALAWLDARK